MGAAQLLALTVTAGAPSAALTEYLQQASYHQATVEDHHQDHIDIDLLER